MIQDYVDHNMLLFLCFSQYVFFFSPLFKVCVCLCVCWLSQVGSLKC